MNDMNADAPALAIEWPWGQALRLDGCAMWNIVEHELTGQMALLNHLIIRPSSRSDMLETIEFLFDIADQHQAYSRDGKRRASGCDDDAEET